MLSDEFLPRTPYQSAAQLATKIKELKMRRDDLGRKAECVVAKSHFRRPKCSVGPSRGAKPGIIAGGTGATGSNQNRHRRRWQRGPVEKR